MFVERGKGELTPLALTPSLMPGDTLIIKRPADLSVDLSIAAAAWSADSRYEPKGIFWKGGPAPKRPQDCILKIPTRPSVVVVTFCLHGNAGTIRQMQRTIELQGERFVQNSAEFTFRADQRNRWNSFFDALVALPDDEDVSSYKEYAQRLSRDLGVPLPESVDFGSSKSLRESVSQTALVLEQLRQASPEELPATYANLVGPLIPGTYRDYISIVYSLYRLAFRPPTEQKLVFVPGVLNRLVDGDKSQVVAGRAFSRTGNERTVAFMNLPVGSRVAGRTMKVGTTRRFLSSPEVVIPIEDDGANLRPDNRILGSPYLWNWRAVIGGRQVPATFAPGNGVKFTVPSNLFEQLETLEVELKVNAGPDPLPIEGRVRLYRPVPIRWTLPDEDRARVIAGANVWVTLQTTPSEQLQTGDIESVTYTTAAGDRVVARQVIYDAGSGRLRAQIQMPEQGTGVGHITVKLIDRPIPDFVEAVRCYAPVTGLAVAPIRAGEQRLVIENDTSSKVVSIKRESGQTESMVSRDGVGRTVIELASPIERNETRILAFLADGRAVELPLFIRGALPVFAALANFSIDAVGIGEGCRLIMPEAALLLDQPLRMILKERSGYRFRPRTQVQVGFRPRAGRDGDITSIVSVPAGQVWFDERETGVELVITTLLTQLFGNQEGPPNQSQLMLRIAEPNDDFSPWTPVSVSTSGKLVSVLRTPTVRSIKRDGDRITLVFNNSGLVLGASTGATTDLIPTEIDTATTVRVTVTPREGSFFIQVAGVSQRLEIKLP
jgi:hypothetical protein